MSAKGFKRVGDALSAKAEPPVMGAESLQALSGSGRDPATVLAAAAAVAPTLPPTRLEAPVPTDPIAQLNLKVRTSLIDQLADVAAREGTTQKVIVCRALAKAGFRVHDDDLSDRGNHRRRRA